MKLIIDIPEEVYKRIIFYKEFHDLSDCVTTIKAMENGTPLEEELEKIKAELQTEKDKSNNTYYAMKSVGLSTAIKIIDNHISELEGGAE